MIRRTQSDLPIQSDLFKVELRMIVGEKHPLVLLAKSIDWKSFEDTLAGYFETQQPRGRKSLPVRLMVGLMYLKYAFNLSDEATVANWVENPYWQYFTGGIFFEHEPPIDPSSMTRWRNRLGKEGLEQFLIESIKTGLKENFLPKKALQSVVVDTTVQPKNIHFPTDGRLYHRLRERLVKEANALGIRLRQSYERIGRKELRANSGYAKAHQMKRFKKSTRRLKTFLRRVTEDIKRKATSYSKSLERFLHLSDRLLAQERTSKNKIYAIHEPDVACIAKGKSGKPYEFGSKVSIVSTAQKNWIVAAVNLSGNPYDGHTLNASIQACEQITQVHPHTVVCDLGYRKHDYAGPATVHIANRFAKKRPARIIRKLWGRRSAIEPIIGHLKEDHRVGRNYLSGRSGDEANIILAAAGFNIRKLLRAFAYFLSFILPCIQKRIPFTHWHSLAMSY